MVIGSYGESFGGDDSSRSERQRRREEDIAVFNESPELRTDQRYDAGVISESILSNEEVVTTHYVAKMVDAVHRQLVGETWLSSVQLLTIRKVLDTLKRAPKRGESLKDYLFEVNTVVRTKSGKDDLSNEHENPVELGEEDCVEVYEVLVKLWKDAARVIKEEEEDFSM